MKDLIDLSDAEMGFVHDLLCSATVCVFVSYTFASRHIAVNDDFPPVTTGKKKLKARVVAIEEKKDWTVESLCYCLWTRHTSKKSEQKIKTIHSGVNSFQKKSFEPQKLPQKLDFA